MRVVEHTSDSLAVERRPLSKVVAGILNVCAERERFRPRRAARLLLWMSKERPRLLRKTSRRDNLDPLAREMIRVVTARSTLRG